MTTNPDSSEETAGQKPHLREYARQQQEFLSGAYQKMRPEDRMEYWYVQAHIEKNLLFDTPAYSPAVAVLNREWVERVKQHEADPEAIIEFIIHSYFVNEKIARQMAMLSRYSEEWKKIALSLGPQGGF